ncbi:hypothetical protein Bbelb_381370 [Branchiostoma belcheri]|nr:hypothetical protein Bbelb_381370 [Branchiostoma belcheri]
METGGKCVLSGQAYPGQGVWSVPDAGVGAPTPRSVPRLCQISGADEKQFKGWVIVLWQTVLEMQRAHQEQIAKLYRQFSESIACLQENFVKSCTSRVRGRAVKSPQTHPCVLCHKLGHWKRSCALNIGNVSKGRSNDGRRSRQLSPRTHPCFVCRQFGHWKAHCPQRKRNRLDDQVNGQVKTGKSHKPGAIMSDFCVSKTVAPSRKRRQRGLTPGTGPGRQVCRDGGTEPAVPSVSGSDSDDDGELGGADVAAHPGDLSGEETAASSGEDTDETASSEEDGSAQLDETDDKTRPKGVAAQTDGAAGGATQDGGGSDASAEGNAMCESTRAQADEASDGDDGGDDSGSGPRRSTHSRQPPERYGSYVYRVTVGHSRDGRHDVNNVNSVNNVNCGSNNAKLSCYRHNPGIRESPAMVGQVTPPLTEEQQGVCEGSKALDESAGSWLDSIFCFMRRSDAQSKVEIV